MGQLIITDTNKSPLVEILVWVLLTTSVMAVTARTVTKVAYVRKFELDDILILSSTVLAIAQSSAVWVSADEGFGQSLDMLSDSRIEALLKSQYAANMLNAAVLCLIKLSVLSFIKSLTANRQHRRLVTALGAFVLLWAISAEFSVAFLCHLPAPWYYIHNKCFDSQIGFWRYFAATNILTDAAQILLVIGIVISIKTSRKKKLTLSIVFGVRALVIVMTIIQIVLLNQARTSQNLTFDLWPFVTSTQAIQCLSFVTACIPYLKPFLSSLESGLLRVDDLHGFGTTIMDSRSRGGLSSRGKTLSSINTKSTPSQALELDSLRSIQHTAEGTSAGDGDHGWGRQSQSSQARIITETRSWTVNVEGNAEAWSRGQAAMR